MDQLAALGVVGGGVAGDGDGDDEIGQPLGLRDIAQDAGRESAIEHADDGLESEAARGAS